MKLRTLSVLTGSDAPQFGIAAMNLEKTFAHSLSGMKDDYVRTLRARGPSLTAASDIVVTEKIKILSDAVQIAANNFSASEIAKEIDLPLSLSASRERS